jgi:asparagine synthase (glutamine-hydrolysing)
MCGICGVFARDGGLSPEVRASVPEMTAALAHRGPDGVGFFSNDHVAFGHRRLAIIDRASGNQPMANEDESCWVVFNGEIYNYRALRDRLAGKGHRFRTQSDTEVILRAYEEFGERCVDFLDGMFAFAIYDKRKRELFAARDRLGKKPFFYAELGGIFHFASELPALRRSPLWTDDIDLSSLEGYLSLGYFIAPSTVFRHARKLPPASTLRVSNGCVTVATYWDVPEFDTDHRSASDIIKEADERLRAAVAARLESEVPLGAFLSGGIDSGLIVSYMAETLADRLVTASVGFGEPAHNELEAAGWTAKQFGSRHYSEIIRPRLDEVIGPIARSLGEPLADSSAIPTWYLARAAREHVTVALSGDCGDEGFAGYDFRYMPHALEAAARRFVPGRLAPLMAWLGRRWPRSPRLPRPLRLGGLLENLGTDPATAYYRDLTFFRPADARRLMGQAPDRDPTLSPVYHAVTDPYRRCASTDPVQRAEYADLKVYLPNNSLVKVDRMSMVHGLEVRSPLLDRHVIEFAFRIPASRKQSFTQSKLILRELAFHRLPKPFWRLPKHGFSAPVGNWIREVPGTIFEDEVLGPTSSIGQWVDLKELTRHFREHREGTVDRGYILWACWVLERWLRSLGDR